MYSIDTSEITEWLNNPQTVVIDFGTVTLTETDIVSGGMSINRYVSNGSSIELGTAIAGELSLEINNSDGTYNSVFFEGMECSVTLTAGSSSISAGYYIVDEVTRSAGRINIVALDRMVLFDQYVDFSALTFPMTVGELLTQCCTDCGITLASDVSGYANYSYSITAVPATDGTVLNTTYRTLVGWCASMMGCCALMDENGQLKVSWFTSIGGGASAIVGQAIAGESVVGSSASSDTYTLSPSVRFDSTVGEATVTLTGITFTSGSLSYTGGESTYTITVADNKLLQSDQQTAVDSVSEQILGGWHTFTPFSASTLAMPFLEPLDALMFLDTEGNTYEIGITDITYTLNASTSLEGKIDSTTKNDYANIVSQSDALNLAWSTFETTTSSITATVNSLEGLTMTSASGVFESDVTYYYKDDDGSYVVYTDYTVGDTIPDGIYVYSALEETRSMIEQTADSITATVKNIYAEGMSLASGTYLEGVTYYAVDDTTDSGFVALVAGTDYTVGDTIPSTGVYVETAYKSANSQITQTAEEIELSIDTLGNNIMISVAGSVFEDNTTYYYKDDDGNWEIYTDYTVGNYIPTGVYIQTALYDANSKITETADSITSQVQASYASGMALASGTYLEGVTYYEVDTSTVSGFSALTAGTDYTVGNSIPSTGVYVESAYLSATSTIEQTADSITLQIEGTEVKNYAGYPYVSSTGLVSGNTTWTINDDNTLTAVRTATGTLARFYLNNYTTSRTLPAGTYTISGAPADGVIVITIYTDSTRTMSTSVSGTGQKTFTMSSAFTYTLQCQLASTVAAGTYEFAPMLNTGTLAHVYADPALSAKQMVGEINLLAGSVQIDAENIDLNGYVTVTDLSTSGSTTINGANITTGTISADRLELTDYVTVTDLSTDGSTTINGGNITTGMITSADGKNYWDLTSGGEFHIESGTFDVTASSSSDNRIALGYGSYKTSVSPTGVSLITSTTPDDFQNATDGYSAVLNATGLTFYDLSQGSWLTNTNGVTVDHNSVIPRTASITATTGNSSTAGSNFYGVVATSLVCSSYHVLGGYVNTNGYMCLPFKYNINGTQVWCFKVYSQSASSDIYSLNGVEVTITYFWANITS